MIVRAHAKINIALRVVDKLENGYHTLDMVIVPIQLRDSIEITRMPETYDTLVTCNAFDLTSDEFNLCAIAIRKMRDFYKFKDSFRVHIHKRIPMAAGLGGGSSDAAAVIKAIISLLKLKVKEKDIISICHEIGSDVPFFWYQKPARVQGTGEIINPIKIKNTYHVLLVKPAAGLPTPHVYEKFDQLQLTFNNEIDKVIHALKVGDDNLLGETIFNELEPAAMELCPEIKVIKEKLQEDGLTAVGMSGSGTAVFALSSNYKQLKKLSSKYRKDGYLVILSEIIR